MARIVKEEEYTVRRNEILDAARRLVYTRGYEQMTIQDILEILEISKGAFYHYFSSKQELLEALIDRMIDEAEQVVGPIVRDPHLPAREKLEQYFTTAARWKTDQKEYFLALLRIWYTDDNAIVRQKMFTGALERFGPMFTDVVEQGVAEGVFHPAYPDMAGELILSLMTNFSDSIINLVLNATPEGDNLQRLQRLMGAYTDAMERVLGIPPGSLHLVEEGVLEAWVPPPKGAAPHPPAPSP